MDRQCIPAIVCLQDLKIKRDSTFTGNLWAMQIFKGATFGYEEDGGPNFDASFGIQGGTHVDVPPAYPDKVGAWGVCTLVRNDLASKLGPELRVFMPPMEYWDVDDRVINFYFETSNWMLAVIYSTLGRTSSPTTMTFEKSSWATISRMICRVSIVAFFEGRGMRLASSTLVLPSLSTVRR
jgi:hypothetical protein